MASTVARQQAIAAGYSPEEVDAFISHEGGDRTSDTRVLTAFNQQAGENPAQGPGATSGGAPGMPGSMQGLNTVVNPGPVNDAATALGAIGSMSGGAGGGEAGILDSRGGSLRGLGRRMPPQESMALAGLGRRVY